LPQSRVEIGNFLGALVKTVGLRWSAFDIMRKEGSLRMRPTTWYKLRTRMARSIPSMERLGGPICRQSRDQIMAAYLLSELEIQRHILRQYREKMVLRWCPPGPYRIGRPHLHWTSAGTKAWDDGLMLAYPWAHPKKTKHMGDKV